MKSAGIKRINDIIKSTLSVIDQSRGAIFDIAESARKEVNNLKDELQRLKKEAIIVIEKCEKLDIQVAKSRRRLSIINSEFDRFSEYDMKEAYQEANELMIELATAREQERQIILQRNDVERRLKTAIDTVGKAEQLVAQVGTVFSYLSGDLQRMDEQIESSENKRMLAIRIIKAQEIERRRIAREMHDGPAQAMSNVVLKSEICEKLSQIDMAKAITELKSLKDVVRSCLTDVRRIIYDLRPMSIDDLGLKPTLQKYIETFQQETKITVELKTKHGEKEIKDSNIVLTIFRVVQECLSNTRKHSKATFVSIQIEFTENTVTLRIKDDGMGFDTSTLNELNHSERSGFGVLGMKERVELLGGSFAIESSIGAGTTVRVKLPLDIQGVV